MVSGSVAHDVVMDFPGSLAGLFPVGPSEPRNECFAIPELRRGFGGCGGNVAYACALHELPTRLVAAAGGDFGPFRAWLASAGVDASGVRVFPELPTASCFMTRDRERHQLTGFHPGAMRRAGEVPLLPAGAAPPALAVVASNHVGAMLAHARSCEEAGIPYLFDPGYQTGELTAEQLLQAIGGARLLVVNDAELARVQERTGLDLPALLGRCHVVVETRGAEGASIHRAGEDSLLIPAVSVNVVDPTGAGDAFRGGLVRGLLSGEEWLRCGQLATLSAAYCVEVEGTTTYRFDRAGFDQRYAATFARS